MTLTKAVYDAGFDARQLAAHVGVDAAEAARWLEAGEIPEAHRSAVEALVGGPSANGSDATAARRSDQRSHNRARQGQDGQQAQRKRKGGRGGKSALTAEAQAALRVCSTLAHADSSWRTRIAAISKTDEQDLSTVEGLAAASEAVLALPKRTVEALRAVGQLVDIDNQLKVAMALGQKDRRELAEINRIACALVGGDPGLPNSSDDAGVVVTDRICQITGTAREVLDWLLGAHQ